MSASIREELCLFGTFLGLGCFLHLLYDLLRGCRRALFGGKKSPVVTDFLFWILCGFFLFFVTFYINHGIWRSYLLLGLAAGAFIWNRLFRSSFVKIWSMIFKYPFLLVKNIRKRLLFFEKRCKLLRYQVFRWVLKGKYVHLTLQRGKRIEDGK